ncbi:MAG: hypothetical protein NUV46_03840 [Nanoarchaeota archaeon]|nr:hypothetical protein [Nanoarchaeota archaeon]
MKKPYKREIGKVGGLKVWIVDGSYVRKNIDEEFTTCGEHYVFKKIPKNELWLDNGIDKDDEKYFIDYVLIEHNLMAKGYSYDTTWREGNRVQKREREKDKEFKKIKKLQSKESYKIIDKIHKKLLKKYSNNLQVWVVNGKIVRDLFFIDFVDGGHDKVYSFVPQNEIWLDNGISKKEIKFVLLHEAHERYLMSKGFNYRRHILIQV